MFGAMNPWLPIVALLAILGSFIGGVSTGIKWQAGEQVKTELLIKQAAEVAQMAAAEAISQIEVKNVTIKRQIEREVREVPVYSDCKHSDVGLRTINQALRGANTINDSELPAKSR